MVVMCIHLPTCKCIVGLCFGKETYCTWDELSCSTHKSAPSYLAVNELVVFITVILMHGSLLQVHF